ncbi:hypothetical protein V8C35DRAFT_28405 [Trichoderma chlorosporum]
MPRLKGKIALHEHGQRVGIKQHASISSIPGILFDSKITALPTNKMSIVPPAPLLDHHISLQTPYCIFCRYIVRPGEIIAAVIGQWDSPSYLACTFGFSFPAAAQLEEHATVFQKSKSTSNQWLLCRKSDCHNCATLHDTAIYHIDCLHIVSKSGVSKGPSLHDIWTIASWTESLPKTRYQAPPDVTAGISADKTLVEDRGSILAGVCSLPQELGDLIAGLCPESPAWRLLSTLYRWRIFHPLLDPEIETREFSFDHIKSWCRESGMVTGTSGGGKIRIQLDNLGASRLDYVQDLSAKPNASSHSQNAWYVVEEASTMRAARIETKGPFMRIHQPRSFHLWDTPSPPDAALIRWSREIVDNLRIRSISLKDITGLTVFCQGSAVCGIYPHRDESFLDPFPHDNSPPVAQIIPSVTESGSVNAIFYPFDKGEKISSFWARRCAPNDDNTPGAPDGLVIIMTTGRFQLFGKNVNPIRSEVDFQQLSGNTMATHLLIQDADFPFQKTSYFAAVSASANDMDFSPTVPSQLTQSWERRFFYISKLTYVSWVALANVQKMWLFRQRAPEGTPRRRRWCRGMVLQYEDGRIAVVGACRREPDIDVQVVLRPTSIHYRFGRSARTLAVECATQEVGRDIILGEEEEDWYTIDIGSYSDMKWGLLNSGTIIISH